MTFERKIVVGLEDIRAISFKCAHCEYRVTVSPDKVSGIPAHCPNGHDWTQGEQEAMIVPPLLQFTTTLAKLRTLLSQKALGYRILLEFDEPKAGQ
jgi:hypothetical protein